MVIDTSVLMCILLREPDRVAYLERMQPASRRLLSAASLVEAGVALMRHNAGDNEHLLDPFLERAGIVVVPVERAQALLAREAYRRFGKGRHAAALNFGDCFSYALAVRTGEPLLFKGNDFGKTDVKQA